MIQSGFTFLLLCFDVRYNFRIQTMSLPPVVCRRAHVCGFFAHSGVQHVLTKWATWWVSYKRQEQLTIREQLDSPPNFGWVRVAHLFSFQYCVFFILFVFSLCLLYPVLPVSLDCPFLVSPCVLCTQCYQFLFIVHTWLTLRFSLAFIKTINQ